MSINSGYYAEIGLKAAKRAALKVFEKALKDNRPIPIWNGEKVEYRMPLELDFLVKENKK